MLNRAINAVGLQTFMNHLSLSNQREPLLLHQLSFATTTSRHLEFLLTAGHYKDLLNVGFSWIGGVKEGNGVNTLNVYDVHWRGGGGEFKSGI